MRKILFYSELLRYGGPAQLASKIEQLEEQAALADYENSENLPDHWLTPLVREWIDSLDEADQELVYWVFGEGLSYATCGSRRGITKQAIYKQVKKLKRSLLDYLDFLGVTEELATGRGQEFSSTDDESETAPEGMSSDEQRNPREKESR